MRVPIWTPSAPRAKAAAMDTPSTMPPACNDGKIEAPAPLREEDHGRDGRGALEAAALAPLHDQPVHPGIDRLPRGPERGHDVKHGDPGFVQQRGVPLRVAR